MAVNERVDNIPVISVTSEDVITSSTCNKLPLTDVEDIDSDNDKRKLDFDLYPKLEDDLDKTDTEYVHTSEEEDICSFRPVTPLFVNYDNDNTTLSESVRVMSHDDPIQTHLNTVSQQGNDFLGLSSFQDDGLTDFEDVEASDTETLETVVEFKPTIPAIYSDQQVITITEKVKTDVRKEYKSKRRDAIKNPDSVYSDNDSAEEQGHSLSVRNLASPGGVTDTEELEMPSNENTNEKNSNIKPRVIRDKKLQNKEVKQATKNNTFLSPPIKHSRKSSKKGSSEKNKEIKERVDNNDDPLTDIEDLCLESSTGHLETKEETQNLISHEICEESDLSDEEAMLNIAASSEALGTLKHKRITEKRKIIRQYFLAADVEDYEGVTDFEDVSSVESEEEEEKEDIVVPEARRQKILMKEDSQDQVGTMKVLPLEDTALLGLHVLRPDENYITDVENYSDDDDTVGTINSPVEAEIPEIDDYGTIENSEVFKTEEQKTECSFKKDIDPSTDTEDISIGGGLRRRRKPKAKYGRNQKSKPYLNVTDTEDIIFSDNENTLLVQQTADTGDKTDIEDFDFSDDESYDRKRPSSVTPDIMKRMEYGRTLTTERDKSVPFNKPTLRNIPHIRMLSASPDLHYTTHTDTEELAESGEEDLNTSYSRAETATPMEMEENAVSSVRIVHTRKFNLDAPEEAIHVKGHLEDTHTDFEELEESWGENAESKNNASE